jgi:exosortase/archaeosortase family protein
VDEDKVRQSANGINIGRFILTYLCLLGVFIFLTEYMPFRNIIDIDGSCTDFVVSLASAFIKFMGLPFTSHGRIISLPAASLEVRFGCNGLEAVMLYSAAVIAFPSPWKKKAAGIAAGLLLIQIFNILRIGGLAYAAVHFNKYFDIFHIYIAQGMTIVVSLVTLFAYLHYVARPGKSVQ